MRELRGNLHVHSDQSDGTLPIEEIARIAQSVHLDFIGINDHHAINLENRYIDEVLVLMGTELNSRHSHYLGYNVRQGLKDKQVDGAAAIAHVKKCKGVGIIAHPFEKGSPLVSRGKHYPWQDWNVDGYDGIEIWNLSSQWKDAAIRLDSALRMWFFDRYRPFFAGPCAQALAKWDEVCQGRHVTGVTGSDLHGPQVSLGGIKFKILDYPMLLAAVNNYILVEDLVGVAEADSEQILSALVQGRCWICFDWLELGYGFKFTAESEFGSATMGESLTAPVVLQVKTPYAGQITLLCNGQRVHSVTGHNLEYHAGPGVYRVEVYTKARRKLLPWIFSNPIYVK